MSVDIELGTALRDLIRRGVSFAIYFLPEDKQFHLVMQQGPSAPPTYYSITELRDERGFVMAPFSVTAESPIVCIRPDIVKHGMEQIRETVLSMESKVSAQRVTRKKDVTSPEPQPEYLDVTQAQDVTSPDDTPMKSDDFKRQREYHAAYSLVFYRFIEPLRQGDFSKLVLSRSETHEVSRRYFSPYFVFSQLSTQNADSMTYLCHTPATGTWIGCTPEILLSGKGQELKTVALAGTQRRSALESDFTQDENEDELPLEVLWDEKDRKEQELVSEYIRQVLGGHAIQIDETAPRTVATEKLLHIKTEFNFTLKPRENVCQLLTDLHPTPAVCGLPKEEARQFILANEDYDRRYYTGFLGWFHPQGETHLYVNLRCMHYHHGDRCTVYAGGGLLPNSSSTKEWAETCHKMETMKSFAESYKPMKWNDINL
jgi:isochorismate synthase